MHARQEPTKALRALSHALLVMQELPLRFLGLRQLMTAMYVRKAIMVVQLVVISMCQVHVPPVVREYRPLLCTELRKHLTAMSVQLGIPAQHQHVLYVLLQSTRQKGMLRFVILVVLERRQVVVLQ